MTSRGPPTRTGADCTASLALVRRLSAPPSQVFVACSDPKWLARWFAPGAGFVQSATADPRVGGGFRVDGIDPDGEPYSVSGCYLEIVRNQRIVATWDYDGAVAALKGPTSRIQIDLRARGEDACELTLAHSELANAETAERYRTVWSICIDRMVWSTEPDSADPIFRPSIGAIADLYGDQHRGLQDRFETRALANRLRKATVATALDAEHRAFVEARDMVFLTTVDHRGVPTCSYKGGLPGFVRAKDERTLVLPCYDGNGMFLSAGNILANPKVGLLFIDFEKPHRLRIHGTAKIVRSEAELHAFPGADLLIAVNIFEVFINCPRYVHRYRRTAISPAVPADDHVPEIAPWKNLDFIRDALPPRDRARLEAAGAKPLTREEYRNMTRETPAQASEMKEPDGGS